MITVALKEHPAIDTASIATALQNQALLVQKYWQTGDVQVVTYAKRKPKGAWRIQWYDQLPPGEGGVHLNTRSGLPYAKILLTEGSVAASHEFCEMLVDPLGNRFQEVGNRDYLVEVCDPVESVTYGPNSFYPAAISDFITPFWYNRSGWPADYLYKAEPLSLRPGGYVSYVENGDWFQDFADAIGQITSRNLGPATQMTRSERDALLAKANRCGL